jgi:hypothetical protein
MPVPKLILAGANVPILLAFIYALVCYRSLNRELKIFAWFIFLSGTVQLTSFTLWLYSINNMLLLHAYVGLGFVCLAWFYRTVLEEFIQPRIITTVAVLFLLFSVASSFTGNGPFTFNALALTVESVLVVILSLSTWIFFLHEDASAVRKETVKSLNWINSGLFIYFSSSLLIFYFGDLIMHSFSKVTSRFIWVAHSFFCTVMYFCFITALWKRPAS